MSMLDWARNEVALACKKEAPNRTDDDWDYGCACYESALKAFEALMSDGHSGMSISFTKTILNRLINGNPLTPITDDDFKDVSPISDDSYLKERGLKLDLQCPRMSSLFKSIDLEDNVTYTDVNRAVCKNKHNSYDTYHSGKGDRFVDKLFPISMPYMPESKPYYVITDQCLIDPKHGDWDTEAWYEIITPEGEHIPINYFCKYIGDDDTEVEITEKEFNERKANSK